MSITYPLTAPTGVRSVVFRAVNITGRTQSSFSGRQQVNQWAGQYWEAELSYPPLSAAQAAAMRAFLAALFGGAGTFLLGADGGARPARTEQGNAATVTVNGASQTGNTLALSGTGTLKAGDYMQIGTGSAARLYMNLLDLALPGTADIFPSLRESPANGGSVILASPAGLFRLSENQSEWSVDVMRFCGVSFKAIEAI